jgi:hypothetical protein
MDESGKEKIVMVRAINYPCEFPLTKVQVDGVSACQGFVSIQGTPVRTETATARICPDFETAKQYLVTGLTEYVERYENRLRHFRQRLEDVLATQESDVPEDNRPF